MRKLTNQYLAPALTGILLTACQPTSYHVDLGILAWVALVPLLVTLPEAPLERFWSALVAGAVHYVTGLYWMVFTLHTFGNMNLPASFFVALLLVALEASYLILFVLAWGYVREKRPQVPMALAVPVIWVAIELLRARTPFGGFPWLLIGYSQIGFVPAIQIGDITGVFGVSFLIDLVNSAIAGAVIALRNKIKLPYASIAIALVLLVLDIAYGYWRISHVMLEAAKGEPLKVSLLQGNIKQDMKWTGEADEERYILGIYNRLTSQAAQQGAELIVWPEAATPFAFERDVNGLMLGRWLTSLNTYTLLGSVDYTWDDRRRPRFTNSAYLVTPEGVKGKYSKLHLVPFSERMPFSSLAKFVDKITKGLAGNYNPGTDYTVFEMPKGRFGVIICYEAIFGELTRVFRKKGAELLVNITNDAWFGDTSAPRQHLAMAAFRCAENHCYLIRAANTGISAVVDPVGRILSETGVYVEAKLDAEVRMMPGTTFYAEHGDWFAWLIAAIVLGWLAFEIGLKLKAKYLEKP